MEGNTGSLLFSLSIHALREEGDLLFLRSASLMMHFLSTPSARRATPLLVSPPSSRVRSFYPRPPRGGRPCAGLPPLLILWSFYPRPPRGGRREGSRVNDPCRVFLSTPSARRATATARKKVLRAISFYPRPPRGGRRGARRPSIRRVLFLSTPSARRATRPSTGGISDFFFLSTPSARRAT